MSTNLIHYLPVVSTVVAVLFVRVLWKHWRRNPSARYLMWWMIGVALYGLGTLTEAWTTVFGWSEPVFRTWYISGALLGGAPLAQGTVYLLLARRVADRLTTALLSYIAIASAFVIATPILYDLAEENRLSGEVMAWQWVRLFSPLVNTYAVIFLIGGAIWSAGRYARRGDSPARVKGNVLIAIGAILPGIGGGFARAGTVEVLYVAELIGLVLIWAGYRVIAADRAPSIHATQLESTTTTKPTPKRGTSVKNQKRLFALLAFASLGLAACSSGESIETSTTNVEEVTTTTTGAETTTTTAEGRTFVGADGVETVVDDTSRIVSLNGDLTEIIFELGLGGNVVGVDVTTTYPAEAAALNERGDTVGFAQQLTAEAVLRFQPTLVIGDQQVAPAEAIEQLRGAGIPVVILETQTTLEGVGVKINQVAEILDVPGDGEALATRVMGEIDAAMALIADDPSDPSVAYIYTRGPQVIFIFGAGMPTQAMIEGAGAIDAGARSGVFGPGPLTPEAIVAASPDVIVLPEAGLAALGGIEALLAIPGISETPAGQNQAFLSYDEAYFFNLGPRTGHALAEFIGDLYPDSDG